jgi:hypothetical protein
MAHTMGGMCHDDVSMMTWQCQRLPCVTHFWHFQVDMWNNEEVPHGSLYNHMASCTGRGKHVASVQYVAG